MLSSLFSLLSSLSSLSSLFSVHYPDDGDHEHTAGLHHADVQHEAEEAGHAEPHSRIRCEQQDRVSRVSRVSRSGWGWWNQQGQ
jgi:hypothetical protein